MSTSYTEILSQMRLMLGDQQTSFDITVEADGKKTRYETGTYPIDGPSLRIFIDGKETQDAEVEERTGVITFDEAPKARAILRFVGTKWRYFGTADLQTFVDAAAAEQFHNRTTPTGAQMTVANMPLVEKYPLALAGTIKALWALLTDAAFDIDIYAPDGVSIPRSQRYRQLLEMLDALKGQYKEYEAQLNIGLGRIEVLAARRVSRTTGRLVPLYVEREVEDRMLPTRIHAPVNTYGYDPTEIQEQKIIDLTKMSSGVTTVTQTSTVRATPINGGYLTVDGQIVP